MIRRRYGNDSTPNEVFEVESAVIRCQNPESVQDDDFQVVNWKPIPLTSFNEPIYPGPHEPDSALDTEMENDVDLNITRATKCRHQALITVKVSHDGTMESKDEGGLLVKVDHMLDGFSKKSVRLGNPIAIKIEQGPVFTIYPIKFLKTVNAEVHEEVIYGENGNHFEKCNAEACKQGKNGGSTEDFGFCCSCPPTGSKTAKSWVRGSLNCNDSSGPFESAHCFQNSDYWYAVFQLGSPEIFHQAYIQVYQIVDHENGTQEWVAAGDKGDLAKIDSHNVTHYEDGESLSISYRKIKSIAHTPLDPLKSDSNYLVIPTIFYASVENWTKTERNASVVSKDVKHHEIYHHPVNSGHNSSSKPPPVRSTPEAHWKNGIPDAVLVVPKSIVGDKCSQLGVSLDSLRDQASPCSERVETCLRNQPFELWASDDGRKSTPVHYRLHHFGKAHTPSPFKWIKDSVYFVMEGGGNVAAYFDIQLPVDHLEVTQPGYAAQIVSVSGSSSASSGKLIVEVANSDQVPAFYAVHLLTCTDNLPLQKSQTMVIDAQRIEAFQLDLHYDPHFQLRKHAKCSVAVLNQYNEVVAIRSVLLSPGDTCICYLNCKCACSKESAMSCVPLPNDEFRSAGFTDPTEFFNRNPNLFSASVTRENFSAWILVIIILLILLGLLKGLVGRAYWSELGKFGLCYYPFRPRALDHYYEKEYARLEVVYDEMGNPVDPFTKKRTVERLTYGEELGLNALFFLCFPLFCCFWIIFWCFCARHRDDGDLQAAGQESEYASSQATHPFSSKTSIDSDNLIGAELLGLLSSTENTAAISKSATRISAWHRSSVPETLEEEAEEEEEEEEEEFGGEDSYPAWSKSETSLPTSNPPSTRQSITLRIGTDESGPPSRRSSREPLE